MRLPSRYGLVAAGAGGGAICWWVSESRCLSASTYAAGSSRDGEVQALLSRSGEGGLSPCGDHGGSEAMGLMGHGVQCQHDAGDFVYPGPGGGTIK